MYYNQNTKTKLSRQSLKKVLHCSIPENQESVGEWLLIHDEIPEREDGKIIVKDSIEIRDGVAVQTYRYLDAIDESADEEDDDDRISVIENALMDLAQIISDLESRQFLSENSAAEETF